MWVGLVIPLHEIKETPKPKAFQISTQRRRIFWRIFLKAEKVISLRRFASLQLRPAFSQQKQNKIFFRAKVLRER